MLVPNRLVNLTATAASPTLAGLNKALHLAEVRLGAQVAEVGLVGRQGGVAGRADARQVGNALLTHICSRTRQIQAGDPGGCGKLPAFRIQGAAAASSNI